MAVRLQLGITICLLGGILWLTGCGGGGGSSTSPGGGGSPGEPSSGSPADADNVVTLLEKDGVTTANYPIQIARPFLPGEIADYPRALLDGAPVKTQADVKQRWPDGSAKHVILTFLIPLLTAHSTVSITFDNQTTGNNSGALSRIQMLDSAFDFDARIELTDPSFTTRTATARDLLNDEAVSYWMQGSVATSIILADHGLNAGHDLGFDGNASFRPIFHATFWPGINKVRIRFIGEAANTELLQDMTYALTLKAGWSLPETVYSRSTFTQHAATRWTRTCWLGGAPSRVAVDHNLAYLAETHFLPNYDTTKQISEGGISKSYGKWLTSDREINEAGRWQISMGTAGGRSDIGPYPTWTVQWLYTGDVRLEEQAFGLADLAGNWPMHFRESRPGKNLLRTDEPGIGTGVGKIMSVSNRPSICLWVGFDYTYTEPEDRIVPVGPYSTGGWEPDGAHQPDPFSPQYTLSGDFWYLEELYFWASYSAARYNGKGFYGRGPTGAEGGIHDETRGDAWVFRNRVQAAFLAPDQTPEKNYFTTLTNDAIAIWEGVRDVTDSVFYGNSNWNWGQAVMGEEFAGLGVPVLHHWDRGENGLTQPPVDPALSESGISLWEENFMLYSLGRAKELGFATDGLLTWFSSHLINILSHPDFDPHLVAAYRIPVVRKSDGNYFPSWADLLTGFISPYDAKGKFESYLDDPEHGYSFIALCAASMIRDEPGGEKAWTRIAMRTLFEPALNDIPKWAILPR